MMYDPCEGDMNVQVVARSRRERVVAHNITNPPLLRSLMRWHRTFFEEKFVDPVHHAVNECCASRRNPGGAMSRDGNFDRLDVDRGLCVG